MTNCSDIFVIGGKFDISTEMFIPKERDLCDHNGYVSKTDGHSCKSEVQYILVTPKEGIKEGNRERSRVIEN